LVIGGRAQGEGTLNGSMELKELLIEAKSDAGYSDKQVRVEFYPWWTYFEDVARRLHLLRLRYKLDRTQFGIGVSAFSRGVGYGVKRLTGDLPWWHWRRMLLLGSGLQRFGLSIDTGVYCDGIYHHSISIGGFQWRSVNLPFTKYQIKLNKNAGNTIYSFRQEISRPMGYELLVDPPSRIVGGKAIVLEYEHIEMDDAMEYHQLSKEVMLELAKKYVPVKTDKMPQSSYKSPAPTPKMVLESKLEHEVDTTEEAISKTVEPEGGD
jgi:hypothetical protein